MKCCKTLLTYYTKQQLSNHKNCKTFKSSCTSFQHSGDELYVVESEDKLPHLITQEELNDLVRDLSLSKEKAEILGSRLQEWNLLQEGTKISHF